MALALFLHVISAVVWVGGMFFAVAALRPASAHLPPAERMTVWEGTLARFFRWVLLALVLLLLTGFAMIGKFYGSMAATPLHIHLMMGLGILMMLLFGHVFFAPFRRLRLAVAAVDPDSALRNLNQIRVFVTINLFLGIATIFVATAGRFGVFA